MSQQFNRTKGAVNSQWVDDSAGEARSNSARVLTLAEIPAGRSGVSYKQWKAGLPRQAYASEADRREYTARAEEQNR